MCFPKTKLALRCVLATLIVATQARASDPFADRVVAFRPGGNAGFGIDALPDVVLGPPHGGGESQGSLHVLSLGIEGEITLELDSGICDGPGPDLTVFENAFRAGGPGGAVFAEVGIVAVSDDGEIFVTFAYDPETYEGLAGHTPVLSQPGNGIDPTDPGVSGGDSFDLADVGLATVRFVRITDPGLEIDDPGNRLPPGVSGGFDLDAIAAVHSCVTHATPTGTTPVDATAIPTHSPTPTATASATATPSLDPVVLLVRDIFAGGDDRSDVNQDGLTTAADLVAAIRTGVAAR